MKIGKRFASFLACLTVTSGPAWADSGCVINGPETPQIVIQEFADFECSYCVRGARALKQAMLPFQRNVKLVFRNLPLPLHAHSRVAAQAMSAVCLQGSELANQFQEKLFQNSARLESQGEAYLMALATELGADLPRMKEDMQGEVVAQSLREDKNLADENGFRGTPSFIIGKQTVIGARSPEELRAIIESELHSQAARPDHRSRVVGDRSPR